MYNFEGWTHYRPPGYPIKDTNHNPYLPINPQYGSTHNAVDIWREDTTVTEEELKNKIEALKPQRLK